MQGEIQILSLRRPGQRPLSIRVVRVTERPHQIAFSLHPRDAFELDRQLAPQSLRDFFEQTGQCWWTTHPGAVGTTVFVERRAPVTWAAKINEAMRRPDKALRDPDLAPIVMAAMNQRNKPK